MITYPDCQACDCKQTLKDSSNNQATSGVDGAGVLSYLSSSDLYYDGLASSYFSGDTENGEDWSIMFSEAIAGLGLTSNIGDPSRYKLPLSQQLNIGGGRFVASYDLPIGERINIFNLRESYFSNINKDSKDPKSNHYYTKYFKIFHDFAEN